MMRLQLLLLVSFQGSGDGKLSRKKTCGADTLAEEAIFIHKPNNGIFYKEEEYYVHRSTRSRQIRLSVELNCSSNIDEMKNEWSSCVWTANATECCTKRWGRLYFNEMSGQSNHTFYSNPDDTYSRCIKGEWPGACTDENGTPFEPTERDVAQKLEAKTKNECYTKCGDKGEEIACSWDGKDCIGIRRGKVLPANGTNAIEPENDSACWFHSMNNKGSMPELDEISFLKDTAVFPALGIKEPVKIGSGDEEGDQVAYISHRVYNSLMVNAFSKNNPSLFEKFESNGLLQLEPKQLEMKDCCDSALGVYDEHERFFKSHYVKYIAQMLQAADSSGRSSKEQRNYNSWDLAKINKEVKDTKGAEEFDEIMGRLYAIGTKYSDKWVAFEHYKQNARNNLKQYIKHYKQDLAEELVTKLAIKEDDAVGENTRARIRSALAKVRALAATAQVVSNRKEDAIKSIRDEVRDFQETIYGLQFLGVSRSMVWGTCNDNRTVLGDKEVFRKAIEAMRSLVKNTNSTLEYSNYIDKLEVAYNERDPRLCGLGNMTLGSKPSIDIIDGILFSKGVRRLSAINFAKKIFLPVFSYVLGSSKLAVESTAGDAVAFVFTIPDLTNFVGRNLFGRLVASVSRLISPYGAKPATFLLKSAEGVQASGGLFGKLFGRVIGAVNAVKATANSAGKIIAKFSSSFAKAGVFLGWIGLALAASELHDVINDPDSDKFEVFIATTNLVLSAGLAISGTVGLVAAKVASVAAGFGVWGAGVAAAMGPVIAVMNVVGAVLLFLVLTVALVSWIYNSSFKAPPNSPLKDFTALLEQKELIYPQWRLLSFVHGDGPCFFDPKYIGKGTCMRHTYKNTPSFQSHFENYTVSPDSLDMVTAIGDELAFYSQNIREPPFFVLKTGWVEKLDDWISDIEEECKDFAYSGPKTLFLCGNKIYWTRGIRAAPQKGDEIEIPGKNATTPPREILGIDGRDARFMIFYLDGDMYELKFLDDEPKPVKRMGNFLASSVSAAPNATMVQAIHIGGLFVNLFYTERIEPAGNNILQHYQLAGNDTRHMQSIEFSKDEDEKIEIAGTHQDDTQDMFMAKGKNKIIRWSVFTNPNNGARRSTSMGVAYHTETANSHILKNTAWPESDAGDALDRMGCRNSAMQGNHCCSEDNKCGVGEGDCDGDGPESCMDGLRCEQAIFSDDRCTTH